MAARLRIERVKPTAATSWPASMRSMTSSTPRYRTETVVTPMITVLNRPPNQAHHGAANEAAIPNDPNPWDRTGSTTVPMAEFSHVAVIGLRAATVTRPMETLLDGHRRTRPGPRGAAETDRGGGPGDPPTDRDDHPDDREQRRADPRDRYRHAARGPDPELVDADRRQRLRPDHGDREQGDAGDRHRIRLGEDEQPADDAADALPPANLIATQWSRRTEPVAHPGRKTSARARAASPDPKLQTAASRL